MADTPSEPEQPQSDATWEFPGWGTAERIDNLGSGEAPKPHGKKLNQWFATAICGNDITSSVLYVSALCAIAAGKYAPLSLLIVAALLFLFRSIYAEVGTALPLNGGAYNALLNTTSKGKASIAACLTLLSYMATAVISANEAIHYASNLWQGLPIFGATLVLLGIFAYLSYVGMGESAMVALAIFCFHILTLVVLAIFAGKALLSNTTLFWLNWHAPSEKGILLAVFYGFGAAMLGISGFESSSNFIEEQEPGVFPKTLRNMWIAVAIFNPLMSVLSLGLVPLNQFEAHKTDLLAHMGNVSAGGWLRTWVSIDAVLVLSGAVLTSYVGVTGLIRRMSLDRCLPQFLLIENKLRRTNHWIILLFFGLCCSILAITGGDVETLAGVYTLSFLGVMALFAIGNMLLKVKRQRLPRAVRASWPTVVIALLAVFIGLVANVIGSEEKAQNVRVFGVYFAAVLAVVGVMFLRVQILKTILAVSESVVKNVLALGQRVSDRVISNITDINSLEVVYFAKLDNLAELNRVALYVLENEQTRRLRIIHCYDREDDIPADLAEQLTTLDRIYPQLRIDLVLVKAKFGPQVIDQLSKRLNVPKNYMFISTPGDRFPHNIAELGGVRLII